MSERRLAIIGNGMATGRLLDELLRRGGADSFDIRVYGEEPHGLYNRILIGRIIDGGDAEEITLKPAAWYAENRVSFRPGARVDRLDTADRLVHLSDGTAEPYDDAVFATGSRAFVPPLAGLRDDDGRPRPGVIAYRTLDDGRAIRSRARAGGNAVILGGGLLGLEAAKSLRDLGMDVTVVQRAATLMDQQVDATGGLFLRQAIEALGIRVEVGARAAGVIGAGGVEAVTLENGRTIAADLVVLACGIRPRVDAAAASGLRIGRGVVVDDRLATSAPGVSAVGECAEHDGVVYGIVEPIWEQCRVLADVLTGAAPAAAYRGSRSYTRLKVAGVGVASMGRIQPEDADEVVQVIEERSGTYRRLIVRDDRLVGAVLVGDTAAAARLVRWLDRGDRVPANRLDLLCSPAAFGAAATDPEVCNCHHVTESTLVAAIRSGRTNLPQLSAATSAGTGCGSCRGHLARLLSAHARQATPSPA